MMATTTATATTTTTTAAKCGDAAATPRTTRKRLRRVSAQCRGVIDSKNPAQIRVRLQRIRRRLESFILQPATILNGNDLDVGVLSGQPGLLILSSLIIGCRLSTTDEANSKTAANTELDYFFHGYFLKTE